MKKGKQEKTGIMVVPVIEGPEMDRLMEALQAARSKSAALKCGECDQYMGIAWCNAIIPSPQARPGKYSVSITRSI